MQVLDVLTAPEKPNPHGVVARPVYASPHAQAVHLTLQPGQRIAPHAPPVAVFFYVLEGQGRITIGDESAAVRANQLVTNQPGVVHGVSNDSDGVLRLLVVKAPAMGG